jgi:hypothetical protein
MAERGGKSPLALMKDKVTGRKEGESPNTDGENNRKTERLKDVYGARTFIVVFVTS